MGGQGKGEKELSKRILPSWRFFNSFDSAPRKDIPRIFLSFLSRLQHFEDTFENWTRGNSFFRDKIRKHRFTLRKAKKKSPFQKKNSKSLKWNLIFLRIISTEGEIYNWDCSRLFGSWRALFLGEYPRVFKIPRWGQLPRIISLKGAVYTSGEPLIDSIGKHPARESLENLV